MSDPVSSASPPATARWVKVALVLSLALNLLVVGAVVGAMMRHDRTDWRSHPRERAEAPRDFVRSPFLSALEPGDRRAVGRELMAAEGTIRENRAELRARFERLLTAIRAEPFDRGAIEAILDEQRAAGARRLELAEEAVLARLSAMTPEGRAAYADRLDRSLRRGD